jgi:hypothetical protein
MRPDDPFPNLGFGRGYLGRHGLEDKVANGKVLVLRNCLEEL